VRFDELAGSRVLIVGGRQSAYEWAALIREHGAERIDIVTGTTCRASST
jgi:FAD-dependent urate hydroxylase